MTEEEEMRELKASLDVLWGDPTPSRDISVEDKNRIANSLTQEEIEVIYQLAEEQMLKDTPHFRGMDRQEVATQIAVDWIRVCSRLVEKAHPQAPYAEHVRMVQELFRKPLLYIRQNRKAAVRGEAEGN
jgi:hypothetical protein